MALRKKKKEASEKKARVADYQLILSPMLTEKSALLNQNSTYLFRVPKSVDKKDIREAITRIFKVDVVRVNTLNELGKVKRSMRSSGRRAAYKKAFVTVKQGQSINVVEGI